MVLGQILGWKFMQVFDRQGETLNGFRASTGFLLHVFSRFEFYG